MGSEKQGQNAKSISTPPPREAIIAFLERREWSINTAQALYAFLSQHLFEGQSSRHLIASVAASPEQVDKSNAFLNRIVLESIEFALNNPFASFNRGLPDSQFLQIYPGEHYRLIQGLTWALGAKLFVEIGTHTGLGSFAALQNPGVHVHTFDLIPWQNFQSHLTSADFASGRVVQSLADLSQKDAFRAHETILNSADIIFLDAPKDGVFEYKFLERLRLLRPTSQRLLLIDDIRFVNMFQLWRSIRSPKLDISSFGHWSGTGLVDISDGLLISDALQNK